MVKSRMEWSNLVAAPKSNAAKVGTPLFDDPLPVPLIYEQATYSM